MVHRNSIWRILKKLQKVKFMDNNLEVQGFVVFFTHWTNILLGLQRDIGKAMLELFLEIAKHSHVSILMLCV